MLLAAGAGIGVLQEPVCAEAMESGRLIRLLPAYTVPGFDLHALFARPIPLKTRAIMTILEGRCLLPSVRSTSTILCRISSRSSRINDRVEDGLSIVIREQSLNASSPKPSFDVYHQGSTRI